MKKFRFALDTVLEYRQQVQDSLQVELGAITARAHLQEQAVADARARYAQINEEYREKKAAGMRIAEVCGYETALEAQEMVIRKETVLLHKLLKQAEAKRGELVTAKQDASSVEKLREKKLWAYRMELQKSEEQLIDDLVCARGGINQGAAL